MKQEKSLQACTLAAYVEWQELMARLGVQSFNWVLPRGESVLY